MGTIRETTPSSPLSWCGATSYYIGSAPSHHVVHAGAAFLIAHRTGKTPHIADFGCWTGRHVPILAEVAGPTGSISCVDGPWAAGQVAELRRLYSWAETVEAHLYDLPFSNGSIDAALCWRVLHNVTDLARLALILRELRRVMRTGAPLVVAVRAHEHEGNVPILFERPNGDGGRRTDRYYSRQSLKAVFHLFGFDLIETHQIEEGEIVDGKTVKHPYLAGHFLAI